MIYKHWRVKFQSSEQAAQDAFKQIELLSDKVCSLSNALAVHKLNSEQCIKARDKAWLERDAMAAQVEQLREGHDYFKKGMAELQDYIDKMEPTNALIKEALLKAHDLLSGNRHYPDNEHYDFIRSASAMPAQCLSEVKALAVEEFAATLRTEAKLFEAQSECRSKGSSWYNWQMYYSKNAEQYANQLRQQAKDQK